MRVLIADDESLARRKLRTLLRDYSDVDVVAECADGREAADTLATTDVDVAFLDIAMPELDGFDVLAHLPQRRVPRVVFVTAYDDYAIRAFEVRAVDYLLKPFNRRRLSETIERLRMRPAPGALPDREQRIAVKSGNRILVLDPARIEWIEAERDYVRIHAGDGHYLVRTTMHDAQSRLTKDFVRIHRSAIVNVRQVQYLEPDAGGDYRVYLRSGKELTLSRTYKHELASRFVAFSSRLVEK